MYFDWITVIFFRKDKKANQSKDHSQYKGCIFFCIGGAFPTIILRIFKISRNKLKKRERRKHGKQ